MCIRDSKVSNVNDALTTANAPAAAEDSQRRMRTSDCKPREAAPARRHTVPGGAQREDRAKASTVSSDTEYCEHTARPTCRGHAGSAHPHGDPR
eukprot:5465584-Alexandrium_andersonii.AAC.1